MLSNLLIILFLVINGGYIASTQNVIVIAANYRLGVFGFWFHEDFEAKMDEEHGLHFNPDLTYSGNQGLMDQQMAMIWTKGKDYLSKS